MRGNLIGDKAKPEAKSKLSVLKAEERGQLKKKRNKKGERGKSGRAEGLINEA